MNEECERAFLEYRQLAARRAKYVPHLAAAPRGAVKSTGGVTKRKAPAARPITRSLTKMTGRERRTRTADGML